MSFLAPNPEKDIAMNTNDEIKLTGLAITRATISVGFKTRMSDGNGGEVQYSMAELQMTPEIELSGSPIQFKPGDTDSEAAATEQLSQLADMVVQAAAEAFIRQIRMAATQKIHKPTIPPETL